MTESTKKKWLLIKAYNTDGINAIQAFPSEDDARAAMENLAKANAERWARKCEITPYTATWSIPRDDYDYVRIAPDACGADTDALLITAYNHDSTITVRAFTTLQEAQATMSKLNRKAANSLTHEGIFWLSHGDWAFARIVSDPSVEEGERRLERQ